MFVKTSKDVTPRLLAYGDILVQSIQWQSSSQHDSRGRYIFRSVATILCSSGYSRERSRTRSCYLTENNLFLVTCPTLSSPSHGGVSYSESPVGGRYPFATVATFSCNSGYNRQGSSTRTCGTSKTWTSQSPTCKRGNRYMSSYLSAHAFFLSLSHKFVFCGDIGVSLN